MHEMSVAMSIVDIAEQTAREKNAEKIVSVTVDIGDLSGVMADAVLFCYEAASRGLRAEGSRLIVNRIGARAWCPECEKEFTPKDAFVTCPECVSFGGKILAGGELAVRSVELE